MYAVVSKSCWQLFVVPYVPYVALHTSLETAVRFPGKGGDVCSCCHEGKAGDSRKHRLGPLTAAAGQFYGVVQPHQCCRHVLTNCSRTSRKRSVRELRNKKRVAFLGVRPRLTCRHGYVLIFTDLFFGFCCLFTLFCLHIERYGVKAERTLH